ncbi:MAG TPA: RIO1 family regulatory kinase/ATPase [Myxococcota bacterium]|jgi:RIO-like serine/threonine protein kinase
MALLDAALLDASTVQFLRRRSRTRPDLRLIEWQGARAVAKDWTNAWPLVRPHARRCLDREWRALEALADLPGIPRPVARLPHAIILSFVEGRPLQYARLPSSEARGVFFDALAARVDAMHARGVIHLDLRQRRNILCGPDGQPKLLDFEAALVCDPASLAGRIALYWGRRVDRLAILKHKRRYAASWLTPRERRLAEVLRVSRWAWPSAVLHRARVALRRLRRGDNL